MLSSDVVWSDLDQASLLQAANHLAKVRIALEVSIATCSIELSSLALSSNG
jgi:hypothetical protein